MISMNTALHATHIHTTHLLLLLLLLAPLGTALPGSSSLCPLLLRGAAPAG